MCCYIIVCHITSYVWPRPPNSTTSNEDPALHSQRSPESACLRWWGLHPGVASPYHGPAWAIITLYCCTLFKLLFSAADQVVCAIVHSVLLDAKGYFWLLATAFGFLKTGRIERVLVLLVELLGDASASSNVTHIHHCSQPLSICIITVHTIYTYTRIITLQVHYYYYDYYILRKSSWILLVLFPC